MLIKNKACDFKGIVDADFFDNAVPDGALFAVRKGIIKSAEVIG